jgi:hypothetical protein
MENTGVTLWKQLLASFGPIAWHLGIEINEAAA